MTAVDVYDFEGNIPDTFAVGFTAANLNVGTTNIAPNVQKTRPRSELVFRQSGAASPVQTIGIQKASAAPRRVIGAYTGELEISLITEPGEAGKSQHSAYRAGVRQLMELDTIRNAVNLTSSPYQIDFVAPNSSTDVISTDKGYETSRLIYSVQFSIKVDAFKQLAGI